MFQDYGIFVDKSYWNKLNEISAASAIQKKVSSVTYSGGRFRPFISSIVEKVLTL
jgi:hypothetical protein